MHKDRKSGKNRILLLQYKYLYVKIILLQLKYLFERNTNSEEYLWLINHRSFS